MSLGIVASLGQYAKIGIICENVKLGQYAKV